MKYLRLLFFLSLVIAFGILIKQIPKRVVINSVDCKSQYGSCNQKLAADLEEISGKSITQAKKDILSILQDNFLVRQYSYQYLFPDKLSVYVVESKAVYAIKVTSEDKLYLVDNRGYIMSVTDSTNLPILETSGGEYEVGEKLSDEQKFAGDLLYNVYYSHQTRYANLQQDGLYMQVGNIDIVFPREGDEKLLVGSLNAIITRLRSDYEKSKIDNVGGRNCTCYIQNECRDSCSIDLRFKNPVIR